MASVDVKEQILQASGPIFAQRGFEKATVREICAEAEVNIAAINYYFGDKQNLYLETVKRAYQIRSTQIPMPDWAPDASGEEKLRGFVSTLIRRIAVLDEAPWESQLLFREVLHPTDACKTLIENHFRPQLVLMSSIIRELMPGDPPQSRIHKMAFSIFGQCMFYRVAGEVVGMMISEEELDRDYQPEQLGSHIADVALLAIKHHPDSWLEEKDYVPAPASETTDAVKDQR